MSYVLGTIDRGGFIKLLDRRTMVHRETLSLHTSGESCYATLDAAKANYLQVKPYPAEEKLIIKLRKDGGVDSLWVVDKDRQEVQARLRIWSGCYGAWPLRKLNG